MSTAAVVVGLAAGGSFGLGTVLQARAARQAPSDDALRGALLVELARRPAWRWGIAAAVGSYGLQALALSLGPIALVEPLIVTDLLFALPLAARLAGRRLGIRERLGAVLVVVGLATFLLVSRPTAGVNSPSDFHWLLVIAAVAALVAVALLAARGPSGVRRTSMLAAAAGLTLGLMSALTKTLTGLLSERGLGAFASWQPYALALVGAAGLLLSQSAFQAGPLAIGLPVIDILEPIVAVIIAATAFNEKLTMTPGGLALEATSALLVVAGISTLDRSPLVLSAQQDAAGLAPKPAAAVPAPTPVAAAARSLAHTPQRALEGASTAGGHHRPARPAGNRECTLVLDRPEAREPSGCRG